MRADISREAITHHTLQVQLQLFVTTRDVFKEISPLRALTFGRGCGDLGHAAIAPVRPHSASFEVNDSTRRIE